MCLALIGRRSLRLYFGARLAAGGRNVTFDVRGAQLAAMRQRGLKVESTLGEIYLPEVAVTDDVRAIGPVDLIIMAVKLWDTEEAAEQIAPVVRAGTPVVLLQNGVHKDELVCRLFGEGR